MKWSKNFSKKSSKTTLLRRYPKNKKCGLMMTLWKNINNLYHLKLGKNAKALPENKKLSYILQTPTVKNLTPYSKSMFKIRASFLPTRSKMEYRLHRNLNGRAKMTWALSWKKGSSISAVTLAFTQSPQTMTPTNRKTVKISHVRM